MCVKRKATCRMKYEIGFYNFTFSCSFFVSRKDLFCACPLRFLTSCVFFNVTGWEIGWCGIIQIPTSFFILLYPRGPFSAWKHFVLNLKQSESTIFGFTDIERLQLCQKIGGGWRPPSEVLEHKKSSIF